MTDATLSSQDYKIGLGNYNAFFGAWLKRGFFTRQRLYLWFAVTVGIIGMGFYQMRGHLGTFSFVKHPGLSFEIFLLGVSFVVGSLVYLLFSALIVYGLSALLTYVSQLIGFLLGSATRRPQTVTITPHAVTKYIGDASSTLAWSNIARVVATRRSVLLFTGRNSAIIVPKRAFDTPEAADAFAASAQHFWTEATGGKDAAKHPEAHF